MVVRGSGGRGGDALLPASRAMGLGFWTPSCCVSSVFPLASLLAKWQDMNKACLPIGGLVAVWPARACAHSEATGSGLLAGLLHPVTGLDHLLAMLAVGIVSVLMGGAHIWRVPAAFVYAMVWGAVFGFQGAALPFVEAGIAMSVLLLGLAVAWAAQANDGPRLSPARLPGAVFPAVLLFGFCHGVAHGVELPRAAAPLFFSMGFLIATVFIHVCGIFVGELASGASWRSRVLRVCGLAMAGAGAWFAWQ